MQEILNSNDQELKAQLINEPEVQALFSKNSLTQTEKVEQFKDFVNLAVLSNERNINNPSWTNQVLNGLSTAVTYAKDGVVCVACSAKDIVVDGAKFVWNNPEKTVGIVFIAGGMYLLSGTSVNPIEGFDTAKNMLRF